MLPSIAHDLTMIDTVLCYSTSVKVISSHMELSYEIVRRAPDGAHRIPANEISILEPGDMLHVISRRGQTLAETR
jgi:hypothetical protein